MTPHEQSVLATFWSAPPEALFDAEDTAIALAREPASLSSLSLPRYRIGRKIAYRKQDVVDLIEKSRQEATDGATA